MCRLHGDDDSLRFKNLGFPGPAPSEPSQAPVNVSVPFTDLRATGFVSDTDLSRQCPQPAPRCLPFPQGPRGPCQAAAGEGVTEQPVRCEIKIESLALVCRKIKKS